jgi:hypothetical protein
MSYHLAVYELTVCYFGDVNNLVPNGMISSMVVNPSFLNEKYAHKVCGEKVAIIAPIKWIATIHRSTVLIHDSYIVFNRWNFEVYITNC